VEPFFGKKLSIKACYQENVQVKSKTKQNNKQQTKLRLLDVQIFLDYIVKLSA